MTDAMNLHSFPQSEGGNETRPASAPIQSPLVASHEAIGQIVEIGGSGRPDRKWSPRRLTELASDPDPSIAMSGQVGSQIKIASGRRWLLANVRRLKVTDAEAGVVAAEIDFLGEGDEDAQTGRLINFKRGITSYPIPGSKAYPVAGEDLKQMFAADERAHIEIGTVYPTKGRARRALRRCPARQAFRAARLDRHRQIDCGRADHAPDLRPFARGPYRDGRSARRIFGRVQGPWRIGSTSTIWPCLIG